MRRTIIIALAAIFGIGGHSRADWNSVIAASNPLNWYRLDETSGSIAFDYGSEGLDGTYGTAAVNAPSLGAMGLVGGAVTFDGNKRNILLNGSDISGDWSAEFVLMKTGTKSSAELLRGPGLAFPSTHLKLEQHPNTQQVGYTQSFVADFVFSPPVFAPLNEFVDLVYVKTAGEMKLYVNGVLKGTNGSTIVLSRYQFGDTELESPIAVVDEIVVYNRALTPAEVADHFNAIPEPASLVLAAIGFVFVAIAGCRLRVRAKHTSVGDTSVAERFGEVDS